MLSPSSLLRPKLPEAAELYKQHVNPAFIRLLGMLGYGRVMARARGGVLFDEEGRSYRDFLAGFGTNVLGHNPPRLVGALKDALDEDLPNVIHTGPQSWAAKLAAAFAARVPHLGMCLTSLSGGEAVEAALKLARAASGRAGIVYCSGGFHGTGLGNLSVLGHARWQRPFQPLLPECTAVPFGDADALQYVFKKKRPAAFLLEPIQAEAGVVTPPRGHLLAAQALCREHGVLLVLDEVQTGMGRTGKLFAFEHEAGLLPDVVIAGKALGAGLLPVSAILTRRDLVEKAYGSMTTFDLHGSTYAGYALGCRVALAVLQAVDAERLAWVEARGSELRDGLRARLAGHPFVRDVRGAGLLVGLELGPTGAKLLDKIAPALTEVVAKQVFGQWLAIRLLERGFLCQPASQEWNVLKLTPPLDVAAADVGDMVDAVVAVLGEYESLPPLLADVSKRFSEQVLSGGRFR
jgi:putrescine aminotransferase